MLCENRQKENWEQLRLAKTTDYNQAARYIFWLLISYVAHSEVIHLTVYTVIEAKTNWYVEKLTARLIIDSNFLGHDKRN